MEDPLGIGLEEAERHDVMPGDTSRVTRVSGMTSPIEQYHPDRVGTDDPLALRAQHPTPMDHSPQEMSIKGAIHTSSRCVANPVLYERRAGSLTIPSHLAVGVPRNDHATATCEQMIHSSPAPKRMR